MTSGVMAIMRFAGGTIVNLRVQGSDAFSMDGAKQDQRCAALGLEGSFDHDLFDGSGRSWKKKSDV